MRNLFNLFLFFLFIILSLQAEHPPLQTPTPYVNAVNVITGKGSILPSIQQEYYQVGDNEIEGTSIYLAKGDFRIGRVKWQKSQAEDRSWHINCRFFYFPGYTEVFDALNHKSVYRYSSKGYLTTVEHYHSLSPTSYALYRKERLFWKEIAGQPCLISRVLEDGKGQAHVCWTLLYNSQGQVIKEAIFGNLSGECLIPLVIQSDGTPEGNGIESYSITYTYALENPLLLIKRQEENGLITSYGYDPQTGQLISKRMGDKERLWARYFYFYNAQGLLHQTLLDDGQGEEWQDLTGVSCRQTIGIETDAQGQNEQGQEAETSPCPQQRIGLVDSYGNETEYVYDDFGRLIQTILPAVLDGQERVVRPTLNQAYDISDRVIQKQDGNGHITYTQYNVRGKPIEVLYPDGSRELFRYFLDGSLKEQVAQNGIRTCFKRDVLGRVTAVEQYASNGKRLKALAYHYQGFHLLSITDHQTLKVFFQYDSEGRLIGTRHETKEGIKRLEWVYDQAGQKTNIKEWIGEETFIVRTEDQAESLPHEQSFVFAQDLVILNERGQYVRQQEKVDGYGCREVTIYDALNRPETVFKLNPFGIKIAEKQMRYDANHNKVLEKNLVMAQGQVLRTFTIAWMYDALNRLIGMHEGVGSDLQKNTYYGYNTLGQIEEMIKPDGTRLLHLYNEQGLLASLTASDQSVAYRYVYDEKGRLMQVEDDIHSTSVTRQYDDFDRLIAESFNDQLIFKNQYDLADRRTHLTLPDQSGVAYHYAGVDLVMIERLSAHGESGYQHIYQYENGALAKSQLIGGLGTICHEKDAKGRPCGIISPWWSQQMTGFDPYQQITQFTTQDPAGQDLQSFAYADTHQLEGEEGHFTHQYVYDSLYNRLSCDHQTWHVNDINQLMQTPQADYAYDRNGNLCQKKEAAGLYDYAYDALNRLVRVVKNQQEAVEYYYDPFDRRCAQSFYTWKDGQWKQMHVEYFLYDGQQEIGKVDECGKLIELRLLGLGKGAEIGAAVALELNGHLFAPIHDLQGSMRCLIDVSTKSVVEVYRYSAYGTEQILDGYGKELEASDVGNPWHFLGKRQDPITGFIFFGKRDYDPQLGRWITPDPLFFYDTTNVYAFVKNDPLNRIDLYGLFSIHSVWETLLDQARCCIRYVYTAAQHIYQSLSAKLTFTTEAMSVVYRTGQKFLGDSLFLLTGHQFEETKMGVYGQREVGDKVRVTFINGILTTESVLMENLDLISQSHGGVNVHYVFRATEGWMWDITRALIIKTAFSLGFRSEHAHLLAHKWKELIAEMGGVGEGGMIIHYAHSLGGSDTDRARELLTAEEQKMIRVISIGSATMIRNVGFESVINYVSLNDGVSYLDPFGRFRNLFDPHSNIIFKGSFGDWNPYPICDHILDGSTYQTIIEQLGQRFVLQFQTG